MFTKSFDKYVCEGDYIECTVGDFECRATVYRDECSNKPDERDDGFWPSKDKKAAGYVLPKNYEAEMVKAKRVMAAWEADEWFYCGIAITVTKCGVHPNGKYGVALWGVEANYPDSDNAYLLEVANELLGEAIELAKDKLDELCGCDE